MSWRRRLDEALDAAPPAGPLRVRREGGATAEVDLRAADAIGVRVGRVRLEAPGPLDVGREAARLPGRVRALPDRLVPVEVDPGLGGAVLRSSPDDMRDGEFYEIGVDRDAGFDVRKVAVAPTGEREEVAWDLTRDQLGRLLDELDG